METLQRTANRGSISTGYDVSNSLKFEDATNERLRRDNPNSGQRRTYTVSMWLKRTELGYNRIWGVGISGNDIQAPYFKDTDELIWYDYGGGGYRFNYHTNRKFRDTSAWMHLVFAVDTEQSTEADRVKLYVNGVEETSFSTQTEPSQNADTNWNYQGTWDVGTAIGEDPHFSGYMSEVYFIDDQQLDCTNFGEFDDDTGIWKPKEFSGTFGSNDVYANFDDASSLGADSSGNSNDWTLVNITAADQSQDSPTNNFCTLNQLALDGSVGSSGNITQGATKATATEFDVFITFAPTFGVTRGKWYAEFEYEGSQADNLVGILDMDSVVAYNSRLGKVGVWSVGLYQANGKLYVTSDSGTTDTASWGASAADGDIISVAVDMDNHFIYFAKNGTWQNSGVPTSGSTGTGGVAFDSNKTVGIGCSSYDQGGDEGQIYANYGGFTAGTISSGNADSSGYGNFEYAPPSGYYALCSQNLALYG